MKSLIVGCSSTHGSDTASAVYDIRNTQYSWANLLSQQLGYEPDNQAIPGNSNQAIFHTAIEKLTEYNLLIVGWTGLARESWHYENSNYFFTPNWACSVEDISMKDVYVKKHQEITAVSDREYMLDVLCNQWQFLFLHKMDKKEQLKKVIDYRTALRAVCQQAGVRYIDANIVETIFTDTLTMRTKQGHPTIQEHKKFVENLLLTL
jgi:hypothetical protein